MVPSVLIQVFERAGLRHCSGKGCENSSISTVYGDNDVINTWTVAEVEETSPGAATGRSEPAGECQSSCAGGEGVDLHALLQRRRELQLVVAHSSRVEQRRIEHRRAG